MNSRQALGPVMFDLVGTGVSPDERALLSHPAAGGIILFTRNYESPEQIAELVASIRRERPELLIAVDQEGGRVQRFRAGFTRLPAAARYAERYGSDRAALLSALESAGWLMAAELRSVDVDFSFAPVLDVDCGISEIIGDRSFSQNPDDAADYARAFALGMRRAGMAAVGKHFPGHGGVALDSHLTLPEDPRPYSALADKDLLPFKTLIDSGLEGIMPAHVVYPNVDDKPAGFSTRWITDILRGRLGFDGLVFSDDLSMAGAAFAGGYGERATLALEAGCDMVLVCNQPQAARTVLDALADRPAPQRQDRFERMHGVGTINRDELLASSQWREAVARIEEIADAG